MSRPNINKTSERRTVVINQSLLFLLESYRDALANDGQRFVSNASMNDVSKDFVEWLIKHVRIGFFKTGKKMLNHYNFKILKCQKQALEGK